MIQEKFFIYNVTDMRISNLVTHNQWLCGVYGLLCSNLPPGQVHFVCYTTVCSIVKERSRSKDIKRYLFNLRDR